MYVDIHIYICKNVEICMYVVHGRSIQKHDVWFELGRCTLLIKVECLHLSDCH